MSGEGDFISFHSGCPKAFFLVKLTFNVVMLYLINEAFIYIKGFHAEKIKVQSTSPPLLSGHIFQE